MGKGIGKQPIPTEAEGIYCPGPLIRYWGDLEGSLLLQAVTYTGDIQMPPSGKLADDEIAALKSAYALETVAPTSR